ncbi:MAG: 3-dehydroquinate synthase [Bacteroidia bacterium]
MGEQHHALNAGRYTIFLGNDSLNEISTLLKNGKFSGVFILADENSIQHCLPVLIAQVKKLSGAEIIEIESGEQNKNIDIAKQLWRTLGDLGADRKSLLINLGGGVVSDLGGFVAATFKRGITFVNIPTTLLAQVDASAGGKTGIDLDGIKNEIGVFAEPAMLCIYPDFLKTLPKREMLSGFAECLKHGLITDKSYWLYLNEINIAEASCWNDVVRRSVEIKLEVVTEDPLEKGRRKILNFGHTIGHALESYFLENPQHSLLHGEAVAAGMICEAWLSAEICGLNAEELNEITDAIALKYGYVHLDEMVAHRLLELMRHDKKNEKGALKFTLLKKIGEAVYNKTVSADQIIHALDYYRSCAAHAK